MLHPALQLREALFGERPHACSLHFRGKKEKGRNNTTFSQPILSNLKCKQGSLKIFHRFLLLCVTGYLVYYCSFFFLELFPFSWKISLSLVQNFCSVFMLTRLLGNQYTGRDVLGACIRRDRNSHPNIKEA